MVKKFKHRINYSERESPLNARAENWDDNCPFHDYENALEKSGGICDHPLFNKGHIECHYGEKEMRVPKGCPLREKSLTIKLESIKIED